MQQLQENTIDKAEKKDYALERLSDDRLSDLELLYSEVYGRSAPLNYFRIKYRTDYTQLKYVGFLAYNQNGFPIAYYGVIPCFLKSGDELILSAQSADTMTHPKFRFKGMFVELSLRCFDLCRELGIKLIFGFPNQNSYHGAVLKLGWKQTEIMDCFQIKVNTIPFAKMLRRRIMKDIYQTYCNIVLSAFEIKAEGIENSIRKENWISLHRSEAYLSNKSYHKRSVLKLPGGQAWIKAGEHLVIGDIETDALNFKRLIAALKNIARWTGRTQIHFHASPGTILHELFSKTYSAIPSFPVLFQDFDSGIQIEKIKFNFADIDIF